MGVIAVCAALLVLVLSGCSTVSGPRARGVGGVTSGALADQGIYLGPPGRIPAGTPSGPATPSPVTTTGLGGTTGTNLSVPESEQEAVLGDPANGTATVSEQSALVVARDHEPGFVGPVMIGPPVLVQFDDVRNSVVATAWAIPMKGAVQLSAGAVSIGSASGSQFVSKPPTGTQTAIIFVDAVTGRFITGAGFGPSPS